MITEILLCLALNVYWETKGQPYIEKLAVAHVVINRVESEAYPDTACEVVYEGPVLKGQPVRDRCQFSWYCDGKSDKPTWQAQWEEAQRVATIALQYAHLDPTEGATHYHADYVNPNWASRKTKIAQIGTHIFYTCKGRNAR